MTSNKIGTESAESRNIIYLQKCKASKFTKKKQGKNLEDRLQEILKTFP